MIVDKGPLTGLKVSIVGTGKVGSSLACWIVSRGGQLISATSRAGNSARDLVGKLGGRHLDLARFESAQDDLLLIAVTDAALEETIAMLTRTQQARVALHTSGRESADILALLRTGGSQVGSLHPLMAFPRILERVESASDSVFGIDGDPGATAMARRLAESFGARCAEIPGEFRSLYHLGATLAAGGVITLLASAAGLARSLGLDPTVTSGYLRLAKGAIEQAELSPEIVEAITGPLARDDLDGFSCQVEELRTVDTALADLVESLAQRTLELCGKGAKY